VLSLLTIALHDLSVGYEKLNVHAFKVNHTIVVITTRKGIPKKVVLRIKKTLERQATWASRIAWVVDGFVQAIDVRIRASSYLAFSGQAHY
jgi:hypothetical protein